MTTTTRKNARPHVLTGLAGVCAAGLVICGVAPAASADQHPTEPPPEPDGGISQSDLDSSIIVWDASENIIELGQGSDEDDEDVLVLETDLLFAAMEWEPSESARAAIPELVEEIPEGAAVDVHGHTDSNPVPDDYGFDNQELSERRAQAVADILEDQRPDLELTVEGFGDTEPAVTEDPEDPSTYAANRRVEIRYSE
ncbi:OmpA family protein [Nesterenkonia alba]|uniref:OmpA family protein n=1 Tax=Nesterenkonia alba TaxID=515814 RepID=UPI0012EC2872|nr:OmpA family protein [Nesterenkonia alba]